MPATPDKGTFSVGDISMILTAGGIVISFLMGILAWLVKRDIGRVDAQFEEVFKTIEDMQKHQFECKTTFLKLKTEHDIYCGRCPHVNANPNERPH